MKPPRKKVLITGATRGIGKAIAYKLANSGAYELAICSRSAADLQELTSGLQKQFPKIKVLAEKCDVSRHEQIEEWWVKLREANFFPDVLINNAGTFIRDTITEAAGNNLQSLMQSNLYSAYHLTRLIVPQMKQIKQGQIINICSVAGMQGFANAGSYSITKHAMLGFSRSLREELKAFNIRVTALLPGATLTDSWRETNLPESRFIKAEDIAKAVLMAIEVSPGTVVEDIVLRPLQGDIENEN